MIKVCKGQGKSSRTEGQLFCKHKSEGYGGYILINYLLDRGLKGVKEAEITEDSELMVVTGVNRVRFVEIKR